MDTFYAVLNAEIAAGFQSEIWQIHCIFLREILENLCFVKLIKKRSFCAYFHKMLFPQVNHFHPA